MNKTNQEKYNNFLIKATNDGSKLPDATALCDMVEDAIRNRTYKIKNKENIETFDIIVYFSPDPVFGMYFEDDGDGESVIAISTDTGVKIQYA